MRNAEPSLSYRPSPKNTKPTPSQSQIKAKSQEKPSTAKSNSQTKLRRHPYGPARPPRPTIVPALDDRLPLHTPLAQTGVAVASVKRELETDKENKKKGIGAIQGEEGKEGKEKMPKMKRVVVRGKR